MISRAVPSCLAGVLMVLLVSSSGLAQRKITPKQKKRGPDLIQYVGAVSMFNHISGAVWEIQISNRDRLSPKSSFSMVAGYSSRLVTFKNDTVGRPSKDRWLHGVGAAFLLNNYTKKIGEGFVWSLGVSGNLYFDGPVDLKTFSVFGLATYRLSAGYSSVISPHIGAGLMGSLFKSTLGSDINSIYVMAGCSWLFRI